MMKKRALALLAIAIIAPCNSRPDEIDDFNKMSSSICQQCEDNNVKVNEKDQLRTNLDNAPFISRLVHQGNNLFFKPQILLGTNPSNPFVSNRPAEINDHKAESMKDGTKERYTNIFLNVPEAPTLAPLQMPLLPETVIVEKPVVFPAYNVTTKSQRIILTNEDNTMITPKQPSLEIISPPTIKTEVIVPKPIPHIPTCMVNSINGYGITVPCPPAVVAPPEIINIETNQPHSSTTYALNLPKIPLDATFKLHNHIRATETLIPYTEDFISTTRFLPSFKRSSIPLEIITHPKFVEYHNRPELVFEKIHNNKFTILEEKIPLSTTSSAYFAHNIALERIVPNIVEEKAVIDAAFFPSILEIPVRPVH